MQKDMPLASNETNVAGDGDSKFGPALVHRDKPDIFGRGREKPKARQTLAPFHHNPSIGMGPTLQLQDVPEPNEDTMQRFRDIMASKAQAEENLISGTKRNSRGGKVKEKPGAPADSQGSSISPDGESKTEHALSSPAMDGETLSDETDSISHGLAEFGHPDYRSALKAWGILFKQLPSVDRSEDFDMWMKSSAAVGQPKENLAPESLFQVEQKGSAQSDATNQGDLPNQALPPLNSIGSLIVPDFSLSMSWNKAKELAANLKLLYEYEENVAAYRSTVMPPLLGGLSFPRVEEGTISKEHQMADAPSFSWEGWWQLPPLLAQTSEMYLSFDLRADAVLWITNDMFSCSIRQELEHVTGYDRRGHIMPYLIYIIHDDDEKQTEGENRVATIAASYLYNRVLLRLRRLEAWNQTAMCKHMEPLKLYACFFQRHILQGYVIKPALRRDADASAFTWTGCTVEHLYRIDMSQPYQVKMFTHWLDEITSWATNVFAKGLFLDIKACLCKVPHLEGVISLDEEERGLMEHSE